MRAALSGGKTVSTSYFPQDNTSYFEGCTLNIAEWLKQFTTEETETYLRSFLGRMLFSGDDIYKEVRVLSGGGKGTLHAVQNDDVRL